MDDQWTMVEWKMENMLTILHGTDIVASRKFFIEQKQSHPEAVTLDADSVNLTDLAQVLEGGGLFGESKLLFIEQFLTKRKKSGDYKDIIIYLDTHADHHSIFLWENKELDIGTQKVFKRAAIRPFKLPQTLFAMLDNLKPGNGKLLIKQFHETIESTEVEMVFFMLIRQFRLLLALHPDQTLPQPSLRARRNNPPQDQTVEEIAASPSAPRNDGGIIEEIKKLTWQKGKMQNQAAMFDQKELLAFYTKLFTIERGQKTGTLSTPLTTAIDFFLLEV